LFFSNYGGSWESYLEDFITKAHAGLTAVWSNTIGFPRTRFLFLQGATDGDRFKRWARAKQVPTYFWYSAYPNVTTSNIRNNAMIRQGLAGASTEEEARDWLSLFGSAPRPATSLETEEIQSLLFGGLSPLQEAECILFRLARGRESNKAIGQWLSQVLPDISFGERVPENSALILSVTRSLIDQCGLPGDTIASFPNAFLQGMTEPSRSRILGDTAENEPENWSWGGPKNDEFDGAALLYGEDREKLDAATVRFVNGLKKFGHEVVWRIPLKSPPPRAKRQEPFGFRDGISQPIIRGTFRTQRPFDQIHLVEPGEFILGYADNRGYIPPTPELSPMFDPDNFLALMPVTYDAQLGFAHAVAETNRDLGRNGSFLVIRQLEQDVDKFHRFLSEAASSQFGGQPVGTVSREAWIAAKIVGRWPDGSSLVRNPSYPASEKPRKSNSEPPKPSWKASEPPEPDNGFLFGVEDPQGLRCPYGAHIRRANPRESFAPGSTDQIAITNRHRILRSGRRYEQRETGKEGLLFVCLNADFERQFEFIQQTWVSNPFFHGLSGEADPLLEGDHSGFFTVPTDSEPIRIQGLSSFVQVKGGGYFFLPGKRTLAFLAKHSSTST
jgi:Dyp-type peroxidase family